MSKRKADEISSDPTTIDGDSSRARRGAAAIDHIAAADSTTSTAPPATNNTGTGATAAEEAENKPTRRGRMAAPAEMRIEQKEAMTRLATMSSHGVDCPSWYGFKNSAFVAKRTAAIGPGRQWRNYRQIIERENYHLMPANIPTYASIRSSPSSLPTRKYCDLTGFPAKYTDPQTHLHYYSAVEYQQIKAMHTETIKAMLEIRNQTPSHQLMLRPSPRQ